MTSVVKFEGAEWIGCTFLPMISYGETIFLMRLLIEFGISQNNQRKK